MSQAQRRAGGRGTDGQWAGQQGRPPAKVGGCFMWEPAAVHWFGKRVIGKNSIHNTASVYNPPLACVCVPVCLCIHVASGLFLCYSKYRMSPHLVF